MPSWGKSSAKKDPRGIISSSRTDIISAKPRGSFRGTPRRSMSRSFRGSGRR